MLQWTKDQSGSPVKWRSKCGTFTISHTGNSGSTRVFTANRTSDGSQVGKSGGLQQCKADCEEVYRAGDMDADDA